MKERGGWTSFLEASGNVLAYYQNKRKKKLFPISKVKTTSKKLNTNSTVLQLYHIPYGAEHASSNFFKLRPVHIKALDKISTTTVLKSTEWMKQCKWKTGKKYTKKTDIMESKSLLSIISLFLKISNNS